MLAEVLGAEGNLPRPSAQAVILRVAREPEALLRVVAPTRMREEGALDEIDRQGQGVGPRDGDETGSYRRAVSRRDLILARLAYAFCASRKTGRGGEPPRTDANDIAILIVQLSQANMEAIIP